MMPQSALSQYSEVVQDYFLARPELYDAIAPCMAKEDVTEPPAVIRILLDDMPKARIVKGNGFEITSEIPSEFVSFEVQFDDDPVLFIIEGEVILNRLGSLVAQEKISEIQLTSLAEMLEDV